MDSAEIKEAYRQLKYRVLLILLFYSPFSSADTINISYNGVMIGDSAEQTLNKLPDKYVSYAADYPDKSCFFIGLEDHKNGVEFMIVNGFVALMYFDSEDKDIPTIEGLGIGSTKSQIHKVYPTINAAEHPWRALGSEYLSIEFDNNTGVLFETSAEGLVTDYRFGKTSELYLSEGCS